MVSGDVWVPSVSPRRNIKNAHFKRIRPVSCGTGALACERRASRRSLWASLSARRFSIFHTHRRPRPHSIKLFWMPVPFTRERSLWTRRRLGGLVELLGLPLETARVRRGADSVSKNTCFLKNKLKKSLSRLRTRSSSSSPQITVESLRLFLLVHPRPEILVIGMGATQPRRLHEVEKACAPRTLLDLESPSFERERMRPSSCPVRRPSAKRASQSSRWTRPTRCTPSTFSTTKRDAHTRGVPCLLLCGLVSDGNTGGWRAAHDAAEGPRRVPRPLRRLGNATGLHERCARTSSESRGGRNRLYMPPKHIFAGRASHIFESPKGRRI